MRENILEYELWNSQALFGRAYSASLHDRKSSVREAPDFMYKHNTCRFYFLSSHFPDGFLFDSKFLQ